MKIEFKTKRNANGYRKYLAIDTEAKEFSRNCPKMIMDGIEIKAADISYLERYAREMGFTERDYI